MGYRDQEGAWQDTCLGKLKTGEPFFVLRAQDVLAAKIVRTWAALAEEHGCPAEKVQEARATADAMETWSGFIKLPD